MKILSAEQIRELDAFTIANEPIQSIDLMERAALACTDHVLQQFPGRSFHILAGSGNNGGDGLAMARQLKEAGCKVRLSYLMLGRKSVDFSKNLERFPEAMQLSQLSDLEIREDELLIDAIFGTGLNRAAEGLAKEVINRVNTTENTVLAIDIPSGLFDEENTPAQAVVKADYTLSFQFPKLSFLFPENQIYVGEWSVLDIGLDEDGIAAVDTPYMMLEQKQLSTIKKTRHKFSHKGTFGHAGLLAGSDGMMGAAVLAARAALRSGVGLLTVQSPNVGYEVMQATVPEALCLRSGERYLERVHDTKDYDAIGLGPGLGQAQVTEKAIISFLSRVTAPIVIDADALNCLSKQETFSVPKNSIITPHSKEFERLFGVSKSSYDRLQLQRAKAQEYQIVIVLKGAYTAVACPDGMVYFNSAANSGLATGGSGDVLTGVLTALLAQGYTAEEASVLGVYLHGYAADLLLQTQTEESMIPSDVVEALPQAFASL
jgi:NAD(P)H-hydrate epimerase